MPERDVNEHETHRAFFMPSQIGEAEVFAWESVLEYVTLKHLFREEGCCKLQRHQFPKVLEMKKKSQQRKIQ